MMLKNKDKNRNKNRNKIKVFNHEIFNILHFCTIDIIYINNMACGCLFDVYLMSEYIFLIFAGALFFWRSTLGFWGFVSIY